MGFCRGIMISFVVAAMVVVVVQGQLVPALCIFGDSVVDAGNNNNRGTILKANFFPYGRDFVTHRPTGRFCNGKLATDFTAEYLGFTSYPPPSLSPEATGKALLTGVNFASGGTGYYEGTSTFNRAIPLSQQLSNYKDWKNKVEQMVGKSKADDIISGAIHLISAGSSDFIQNFYINPYLNLRTSPDQFSDTLMTEYSSFVQNLYQLGARRIGVTNLPPTGCLPAAITLFGSGSNDCVQRLNRDATSFNIKLNNTSQNLRKLQGLKLVVFDIYNPLYNLATKPADNGFFESRRACCGTGTLETAVLCNSRSLATCSNATGYVFWDGFHPSEAANQILATSLLEQGFDLIG